jgi:hypothetical protein
VAFHPIVACGWGLIILRQIISRVGRYSPAKLRSWGRGIYYARRHPLHPGLKKFGTVQDLYYWMSDDQYDTVLMLQNYFSAFYPTLNTTTDGTITVFDPDGVRLGSSSFSLAHLGGSKIRISSLLQEIKSPEEVDYGTLEVKINIPGDVSEHIKDEKGLYFWDRFYISYTTKQGQFCFVHGVDKTHIYSEGKSTVGYWYERPQGEAWAPEIPIEMNSYQKFTTVMLNRTSESLETTLTLRDGEDNALSWSAEIPAQGVRRFELTPEDTAALKPDELRMMVTGMASQYGRPMVIKEFPNGAISAMHC